MTPVGKIIVATVAIAILPLAALAEDEAAPEPLPAW
jgi:hypothetical protein